MPRKPPTEGGGERPPQLTHRKSIDRFKAAKLIANILAFFPPNIRAVIIQMAVAGDVDRQVELPVTKGAP